MTLKNIAIIGGGPIGLATAINLSHEGHSVDLYEKSDWPIDKVCGQGLMPRGVERLQKLNITFDKNQYHELKGITYLKENYIINANFVNNYGMGIERTTLSEKLIEEVRKNERITLFSNTELKNIEAFDHFSLLTFKNNESKKYSYVFACDGLNSKIRKILNLEKRRLFNNRQGARVHYNLKPWTNKVEVHWGNNIECYITPSSDNKINVAYLWNRKKHLPTKDIQTYLLDQFPELKKKLPIESRLEDFKVHPSFSIYSKKLKHKNVFFVGDSYLFLDGITGEGVSLGLFSSEYFSKNFQKFTIQNIIHLKLKYYQYTFFVFLALLLSSNKKVIAITFSILKRIPFLFTYLVNKNDI